MSQSTVPFFRFLPEHKAMKKTPPGFTRTLLSIAIPVTLQNLLASSFTLIDTLMIGVLGDMPLAAVGMAGKWTWFLTIVFFGFASGASVFIAQYYGADDTAGIHRTYGLMTVGTQIASALFMLIALLFPEAVVRLFSSDAETITLGASYLRIIAISYPFLALTRGGGTLLQSTGNVIIPFAGSLVSVAVNVILNALLIFGLCGFPALGVQGAAIASLISAIVNALVVYGAGLAKKTLLRTGLSALRGITGSFIRDFAIVSTPAMLNETMWALGNLMYSSVYGHMGTGAYASITVVRTIEELMSVAVMGLCSSCAVMIGGYIGRGDIPLAKLCARRHVELVIGISVVSGAAMLLLRQPLLSLFGVSQAVREDALSVLTIYAFEMTLRNVPSILVMGVFRAGGDTRYGLVIDCITLYLIGLPATAAAGLVFRLSVPMTYLIMYLSEDVFKCIAYITHMRSSKWIRPVI